MRARSVSTLNAGYAAALQMNSPIAEHLQQSLGLDLTHQLCMSLSGSDLQLEFLPLASNANDGLTIDVAPSLPVQFGAGTPEALSEGWLLRVWAESSSFASLDRW